MGWTVKDDVFCDKCGVELHDGESVYHIMQGRIDTVNRMIDHTYADDYIFCQDCWDEVAMC